MIRRLIKYRKRVTGDESGFTLVEQIVTLTIVAMVLTAAMAALATGGLGLNIATSRNEAMSLAQAQMECIKNQGYVLNSDYADCDVGTSRYTLTTVVSDGTNQNVQKIEVTVYRGQDNPVLFLEGLKVERP